MDFKHTLFVIDNLSKDYNTLSEDYAALQEEFWELEDSYRQLDLDYSHELGQHDITYMVCCDLAHCVLKSAGGSHTPEAVYTFVNSLRSLKAEENEIKKNLILNNNKEDRE